MNGVIFICRVGRDEGGCTSVIHLPYVVSMPIKSCAGLAICGLDSATTVEKACQNLP